MFRFFKKIWYKYFTDTISYDMLRPEVKKLIRNFTNRKADHRHGKMDYVFPLSSEEYTQALIKSGAIKKRIIFFVMRMKYIEH